ncbi:hypothetical protein, partial [Enterobacter hormaechei]
MHFIKNHTNFILNFSFVFFFVFKYIIKKFRLLKKKKCNVIEFFFIAGFWRGGEGVPREPSGAMWRPGTRPPTGRWASGYGSP